MDQQRQVQVVVAIAVVEVAIRNHRRALARAARRPYSVLEPGSVMMARLVASHNRANFYDHFRMDRAPFQALVIRLVNDGNLC